MEERVTRPRRSGWRSFQMPDDLRLELDRAATAQDRSKSAVIRAALRHYFREFGGFESREQIAE